MIKKILKTALIVLLWLAIWQVASMAVGKPLIFPSPVLTVKRLFELMLTAAFYKTLGITLMRILCGTLISVVLGVLLAIFTAKFKVAHDILSPLMTVIKVMPVASFIILLLLWTNRDIVPSVISALIVLPIVWTNVEIGILQVDKKLLDMSRVYKMGEANRIKNIYFPSVFPFFISALSSSLGLSWKAGIAAEVIALPLVAIGKQIYEAKLYIEALDLFAWTLAVIVISLTIEKLLVLLIKRLTFKTGGMAA